MNRDAHADFADSPEDFREEIARAVEQREERRDRAVIDSDWPQIERLLRFWRANDCQKMEFRIVR